MDLDIEHVPVVGCGDPSLARSSDEEDLLDDPLRRSMVSTTDLNVYFVKRLNDGGIPTDTMARTYASDCYPGLNDETQSGIIISAERINEFPDRWTLGHEVAHALMNRDNWTPGGDEHFKENGAPLPANNLMLDRLGGNPFLNWPAQCLNINADATIFRGDP